VRNKLNQLTLESEKWEKLLENSQDGILSLSDRGGISAWKLILRQVDSNGNSQYNAEFKDIIASWLTEIEAQGKAVNWEFWNFGDDELLDPQRVADGAERKPKFDSQSPVKKPRSPRKTGNTPTRHVETFSDDVKISPNNQSVQSEDVDSEAAFILPFSGWLIIVLALLFVPLGHWKWPQGWAFFIAQIILGGPLILLVSPKTSSKHRYDHAQIRKSDAFLLRIFVFSAFLGIPLVSSLDYFYGWTANYFPLPYWLPFAAHVLFVATSGIGCSALVHNNWYEPILRRKVDPQLRLCSTGPYAVIRHPAYFSLFALCFLWPLMLNSMWAFIPAVNASTAILLRTVMEEETLSEQLQDYHEYKKHVKSRLLPFLF